MKHNYLEKLEEILYEKDFSAKHIKEIIEEYSQLYDEALEQGKTDEEILKLLGEPKTVAKELSYDYKFIIKKASKHKLVAISPFISVIIFILIGTQLGVWHPTWLIFLSIPVLGILSDAKGFSKLVALTPFISVVTFIVLGTYFNLWNPGWLIFLIIPMIAILEKKNKTHVIIYELSFVVAIAFYLYMGYRYGLWNYGALGFIMPLSFGLYMKDIKFEMDFSKSKKDIYFVSFIFLVIILFILTGILFSAWPYGWQLFLLIPIAAIVTYDKFRFVAISPFIAVIIFFSLGYFFGLFHISWLAFLIIPMAGILEGQNN